MSVETSSEEEFIQRTCVEHEDTLAKSFCAACYYAQTLQENLKTFVAKCDEQENKSKRRQSNLEKNLKSIKKFTRNDIQRLDEQLEQVKNQIETTWDEERALVEKIRKEQQMKLKNERSQLKKQNSHYEELHQNALALPTPTSNISISGAGISFLAK